MSKELIVSSGKHETRVAILEDDQLVEIFHEREKEYSLAGSIHKGRVTRVLPGMQSAFVDIGLERDAFLYVSDFFEDNEEYDAVVSNVEDKVLKLEKRGGGEAAAQPQIADGAIADGEAGAAPSETAEAAVAPAGENRQPQGDRNRDRGDRGGDRGDRRGRRGRRRGGRDRGGLPESKFAPARDVAGEEPVVEAEADDNMPPEPPFDPSAIGDDLMVLPGETIRKYSRVQEVRSTESVSAEDFAEAIVDAADQVEPAVEAISLDHPYAGLATVVPVVEEAGPATLVAAPADEAEAAEAPAEGPATLVAAAAVEPEAAEPPAAEGPATLVAAAVEAEAAEVPAAEGPATLVAAAVEAAEAEESVPAVEAEAADEMEAPAEADAAEGEATAEADAPEGDAVAEGEDEGPEPARQPQSLTATLREQGQRYPHRMSRRMRRRNRGGGDRNGDRQQQGAPQAEGQPAAEPLAEGEIATEEVLTAEVRDEAGVQALQQTPQREGGDRPERSGDRGERNDRGERGDRNGRGRDRGRGRGDRGDRGDRGERGERGERTETGERAERPERERPPLPSIADLLKEGQEIIVQIAKEPIGQKGARITSHIALPGRFVVYMPTVDHAGVSRKIPSDEERQRLKRVIQTHRQGIPGGYICRTAAEGKTEEELKKDMHFLYNLWLDMRQKAEKRPAPVLLHHDLDLVQRILRDQLTTSFKTIWVDNEELYESVLRFAERFQPALIGRIKLYTRPAPIFDEFGITAEIEKALRPKVWLKSGGYIVINQTEALVAIDINTGKYVGKSNRLEDTIVKINTDAIKEIVRQIRIRDLGGIIVVDFIDMDERKNRQKVMQALEEAMRVDRAPYKILQFNDFGLVAITRKRVKQSLERTLCAPCPYCEGAGHVKSAATVVSEILTEAHRLQKALKDEKHNNIVLRVNPEIAKVLKSNHNQFLQEIEETLGKAVLVKSDPLLHQTKFDLA